MTRAEFISRLRRGLGGLSPATIDEIVADHEAHFDEAIAAGRDEAEVAAALGDPGRLAREVRMEAGLKRWEEEKNPSAAASIFAVLGLGAIDILILLPLLIGVLSTLFGVLVSVVALFFAGGVVFAVGPFAEPPGGPMTAILAGVGLMGLVTSAGALLTIFTIWLVNGLVWYGRLHYRLLKPAIQPQTGELS